MGKQPKEETPQKLTGIVIKDIPEVAVGVGAVSSSVKHLSKYMSARQALKTMFKVNQKGGFDCPGCAWPDPDDDRSKIGEYCENGIKAIAEEAQRKTIGAKFFKKNSVYDLSLKSDFELGKMGRLAEPLILKPGSNHYQPISWSDAFRTIAKQLNDLDSPDEAIFYTSGRTSNEAAFLYQLFVRQFGTNNLPDCSNMCHESSGTALSQTIGIGKGSVTLQDMYEAEVILVMGQNPGTNHPRMLSALEKCKENGGKIVTVNPLPEAGLMNFVNPQKPTKMLTGGTKLTDVFLPVKLNGDVALLKAIMQRLIRLDSKTKPILDHTFIKEKTNGFEAFKKKLLDEDYDILIENSGISKEQIEEVVNLIKDKSKIIICWAMGLTQHINGVDNIKEIVNLLLMKGAIGKPGAGTCPVRGHSNVQGDRTMGIWEAPKDSFLDNLEETFQFEAPRKHGYAVVDAIEAMHKKKASVFFAMGGNFLSATPDTLYTAQALRKCSMTIHVSTKLNRSHLIHGETAMILPCLGRTEIDKQLDGKQFVSVENSMGIVHSSEGILPPASKQLKSEVDIVCNLAAETLGDKVPTKWMSFKNNYDSIRDKIEEVIPGFENYNTRVRKGSGFYLPNGAREGTFNTASGKAEFSVIDVPKNILREGEFAMMTIRSHDQYNTTIYGLDDRYRGIYNERRVVLMNKADMNEYGFSNKQLVNLKQQSKGKTRIAERFMVVEYSIPRQCVATYFPEANVLILDHIAKESKTPASKYVTITIEFV
jgi:molybdopterin-dependent oxidoreductase alpha subunit